MALSGLPAPVNVRQARALPPLAGSYLLLIRLAESLPLKGRFAGQVLPAGHYVYAGSARGPGGLRARVSRHLRKRKKVRWHVDQLTTRAAAVLALPFAQENAPTECGLISALLAGDAFDIPLPGFGSSDCSTCPAHLLRWRAETCDEFTAGA